MEQIKCLKTIEVQITQKCVNTVTTENMKNVSLLKSKLYHKPFRLFSSTFIYDRCFIDKLYTCFHQLWYDSMSFELRYCNFSVCYCTVWYSHNVFDYCFTNLSLNFQLGWRQLSLMWGNPNVSHRCFATFCVCFCLIYNS